MILSDRAIKRELKMGKIVIDPYVPNNLNNSSYDLTLGEYYYRERETSWRNVYNIFSEKHTNEVWGPALQAIIAKDCTRLDASSMENIRPDDKVIMIAPGETILAHTHEFVGGRKNITTMMKARSSYGRVFIEVCKCLPSNTLIRMKDGSTKRIDNIFVNDEIINVDKNGKSRISKVKSISKSESYKTTVTFNTNGNRSCTISFDHLLMVSRVDGTHIIEAKDLKNTDYLPVLSNYNNQNVNLYNREEEVELLGYFCAEGHWSKYCISFAKTIEKREQRDRIKFLMKKVFGNWDSIEYPDQITYNGVKECEIFNFLYPEVCKLAPEKRVPSFIMSSDSMNEIRSFLHAYLYCDGTLRKDKNEVITVSRSKKLILDLSFLACKIGAVPRFNEKRCGVANNLHYFGHYYGNDAKRLLNEDCLEDIKHSWNLNIPHLMYLIKDKYKLTRKDLAGVAVTDEKKVSKSRLQKLPFKPYEINQYINDLVWEPIESIQHDHIMRNDLFDISLEVDTEEDSLFALENGLMILNCSGWGDVGYINRWTMEITNNSRHYHIPLVCGRRICQLVFLETYRVDKEYNEKYQETNDLQDLRNSWTPEQMLPKLWKDREIKNHVI